MAFSKLLPGWQNVNDGRPENQHRVQEAVESYATRMMEGSQAPAVIIRKGDDEVGRFSGELDVAKIVKAIDAAG